MYGSAANPTMVPEFKQGDSFETVYGASTSKELLKKSCVQKPSRPEPLQNVTAEMLPEFRQGAKFDMVFGAAGITKDSIKANLTAKPTPSSKVLRAKKWNQMKRGTYNYAAHNKKIKNQSALLSNPGTGEQIDVSVTEFAQGASVGEVFGRVDVQPAVNPTVVKPAFKSNKIPVDLLDHVQAASASTAYTSTCKNNKHYQGKGANRKHIQLRLAGDSHERIEARRLLENRTEERKFHAAMTAMFPDLACYSCPDILAACFFSPAYRESWLSIEQRGQTRFYSHKRVDYMTTTEVTAAVEVSSTRKFAEARISKAPGLRMLDLPMSMCALYGEKFYKMNEELRDKHVSMRCSLICDRIRYRALGSKSRAISYLKSTASLLTYEQRQVAVGMLFLPMRMRQFINHMIAMFPNFPCKTGMETLRHVFSCNLETVVRIRVAVQEEDNDVSLIPELIPPRDPKCHLKYL